MKNEILQKILDDMEKDPWYVKLKRWIRIQFWVYRCLIFNRKQSRCLRWGIK